MHFYEKTCNNDIQCIICLTDDGKTDEDLKNDFYFFKKMNYPCIKVSTIYGCSCNAIVHNKCAFIWNKKNCFICNKKTDNLNLNVKTKLDWYFYYLKKNPIRIYYLKEIVKSFFLLGSSILNGIGCLASYFNFIEINITQILFISIITINIYIILFTIYYVEDYCKKYWLYYKKIICI